MSEHLCLRHPEGETQILVGPALLEEARCVEAVSAWVAGRTVFVVTSQPIQDLHAQRLTALTAGAARTVPLLVPDGEAAKTLEVAGSLWRRMLQAGGKRDSRVIGFGGGSVGDLAGFVAGGFLRGIEVTHVPTTLLAQVDASIGGKTAIDLPEAKNSVGLFVHPRFVLSDTEVLATLGRRHLAAGLAEVVKMALLLDPELLTRVEEELPRLLAGQAEALAPVVAAAARAKIRVVEEDPREAGLRRVLNFGHTLGHALETTLGYRGLLHGEAVIHGMCFALRLARPRGLDAAVAERFAALLERLEAPSLATFVESGPEVFGVEALLTAMSRDKKAREGGLAWVLPAGLGEARITSDISQEEVRRELQAFLSAALG